MHTIYKLANRILRTLVGLEVRRCERGPSPYERVYSKYSKQWNLPKTSEYWIGGCLQVPNASKGYHGILRQWWEYYSLGGSCLLISETNKVKEVFQRLYPAWNFLTLDFYDVQGGEVDIRADLCRDLLGAVGRRFDLTICQATLEHVYDPFTAMHNLVSVTTPGGAIMVHTHTPPFPYHPYPRDYFRFTVDWFEDLNSRIAEIELLELYATSGHIFAAFRRGNSLSH